MTRIRDVRQQRGLTLADVAHKLDTTPATISRWEREPHRVTVPILQNLARVLDVNPTDLLDSVRKRPVAGKEHRIIMVEPMGAGSANPFDADFIAELTRTDPEQLALLVVQGDDMAPTLAQGDLCLVDLTLRQPTTPGLYVLQAEGVGHVRRLQPVLGTAQIRVAQDNGAYGEPVVIAADALSIAGRVIWIGKKV